MLRLITVIALISVGGTTSVSASKVDEKSIALCHGILSAGRVASVGNKEFAELERESGVSIDRYITYVENDDDVISNPDFNFSKTSATGIAALVTGIASADVIAGCLVAIKQRYEN